MEHIGKTLKDWREVAGLTQERAALSLRMPVDRLRKIEQERMDPTGEEYLSIREVLRKANVE